MDWAPPPLIDFDVITERPLFSATRRPYVAPAVEPTPPPPRHVSPPPPVPELQGVLLATRKVAFLDGDALYEGETTDQGWFVELIEPNAVTLSWMGREEVLRLYTGVTCCPVN